MNYNISQDNIKNNIEDNIYDIYDISEQSWFQNNWIFIVVSIFLFLLIGLFIFWRLNKKTKHPKVILAPWEKAIEQLNILNKYSLETQEDHKLFYSKLTDILKDYLQERYKLNEGNTDQELLEILKKKYISEDVLSRLHEIMHHAFMVKFAHHEGQIVQMREDMLRSQYIVNFTRLNNISSSEVLSEKLEKKSLENREENGANGAI